MLSAPLFSVIFFSDDAEGFLAGDAAFSGLAESTLSFFFLGGGSGIFGSIFIIGHVPSRTFEVEAASGNKLVKFSGTVSAFGQGFVRKLLKSFFDCAAFFTLVLVNGHVIPPEKGVVNKYLEQIQT